MGRARAVDAGRRAAPPAPRRAAGPGAVLLLSRAAGNYAEIARTKGVQVDPTTVHAAPVYRDGLNLDALKQARDIPAATGWIDDADRFSGGAPPEKVKGIALVVNSGAARFEDEDYMVAAIRHEMVHVRLLRLTLKHRDDYRRSGGGMSFSQYVDRHVSGPDIRLEDLFESRAPGPSSVEFECANCGQGPFLSQSPTAVVASRPRALWGGSDLRLRQPTLSQSPVIGLLTSRMRLLRIGTLAGRYDGHDVAATLCPGASARTRIRGPGPAAPRVSGGG